MKNKSNAALISADCFFVRSPYFPFSTLMKWSSSDLRGGKDFTLLSQAERLEEWRAAAALIRNRLATDIDNPVFREALHVASPSLESSIRYWKTDPGSRKGKHTERSLVKYFTRMCTRPTPFGLFSGWSLGSVGGLGSKSSFELEPQSQYRSTTQLDYEVLYRLAVSLRSDPETVKYLEFQANSSLVRFGSVWHLLAATLQGDAIKPTLVKINSDPVLDAILAKTQHQNCSYSELAQFVQDHSDSVPFSASEINEYLAELIVGDVLTAALLPALTGRSPALEMLEQLREMPDQSEVVATLTKILELASELDSTAIGSRLHLYDTIAMQFTKLPVPQYHGRMLQVDLAKPARNLQLGPLIIDEVKKAIELCSTFNRAQEPDALTLFRSAFAERYQQAWVPLVEALDEEMGIGFPGTSTSDASPLLGELKLPLAQVRSGLRSSDSLLFKTLMTAINETTAEINLNAEQLMADVSDPGNLASSFGAFVVVAAESAEAADRGDFQILLKGGTGPSPARTIARFTRSSNELETAVRSMLRREECYQPECLFAEIVYSPGGRVGNVVSRPVLRGYEIPYLGKSGAPIDKQIAVEDLLVSQQNGTLILWSKTHHRRVIPRLSSAHGFYNTRLAPIYRFLCMLQEQGGGGVPAFSWGTLSNLDTLPRVRVGRLILALGQWRLNLEEIASIARGESFANFCALQELRVVRHLPQWFCLAEDDNYLVVDSANPLSVDAFTHALRPLSSALLVEKYPYPDMLCLHGPEGGFEHEFVVPMFKDAPSVHPLFVEPKQQTGLAMASEEERVRAVHPGDVWQYYKIYGGPACLDEIVSDIFPQFSGALRSFEPSTLWFFIRYADPQKHIRLRVRAPLMSVQPLISEMLKPYLRSGRIWRLQLDTYEREIERYGGPKAILEVEKIFAADSLAVVTILKQLEKSDAGLSERWKMCLLGLHELITSSQLTNEEARLLILQLRDSFVAEFNLDEGSRQQVHSSYRKYRLEIGKLLSSAGQEVSDTSYNKVFSERSEAVRVPFARIRDLEIVGDLTVSRSEILKGVLHMHVNRVFRGEPRQHELFLYTFLHRFYTEQLR